MKKDTRNFFATMISVPVILGCAAGAHALVAPVVEDVAAEAPVEPSAPIVATSTPITASVVPAASTKGMPVMRTPAPAPAPVVSAPVVSAPAPVSPPVVRTVVRSRRTRAS